MSENYSLIGTLAFLDPSGANPYLELSKAKPVEILNALEIASQRFFKAPTGTNTDRDGLTPTAGCIWFSTTDNKLQVYDGTSWADLH